MTAKNMFSLIKWKTYITFIYLFYLKYAFFVSIKSLYAVSFFSLMEMHNVTSVHCVLTVCDCVRKETNGSKDIG